MAEITVVEPSNEEDGPTITTVTDDGENGDVNWQSALSEVKETLVESFRLIRQEMEERARKSEEMVMRLLEVNSNLTAQMSESQSRIVDSLTRNLSSQTETLIVTPPTDTLSQAEEEIALSEVADAEAVAAEVEEVPARRKRRML